MNNEKKVARGSVHGRFQPPHLDHLAYIKAAADRTEHLIIGIAQPDAPFLDECIEDPHRAQPADNPLTFVERTLAIEKMLTAIGVARDRYSFAKFPIERPEELSQHVPIDTICFTTICNDWNLRKIDTLRGLGYKVEVLWDKRDQKNISGTDIRAKMRASDAQWEENVSPAVSEYLNAAFLVDRIKRG